MALKLETDHISILLPSSHPNLGRALKAVRWLPRCPTSAYYSLSPLPSPPNPLVLVCISHWSRHAPTLASETTLLLTESCDPWLVASTFLSAFTPPLSPPSVSAALHLSLAESLHSVKRLHLLSRHRLFLRHPNLTSAITSYYSNLSHVVSLSRLFSICPLSSPQAAAGARDEGGFSRPAPASNRAAALLTVSWYPRAGGKGSAPPRCSVVKMYVPASDLEAAQEAVLHPFELYCFLALKYKLSSLSFIQTFQEQPDPTSTSSSLSSAPSATILFPLRISDGPIRIPYPFELPISIKVLIHGPPALDLCLDPSPDRMGRQVEEREPSLAEAMAAKEGPGREEGEGVLQSWEMRDAGKSSEQVVEEADCESIESNESAISPPSSFFAQDEAVAAADEVRADDDEREQDEAVAVAAAGKIRNDDDEQEQEVDDESSNDSFNRVIGGRDVFETPGVLGGLSPPSHSLAPRSPSPRLSPSSLETARLQALPPPSPPRALPPTDSDSDDELFGHGGVVLNTLTSHTPHAHDDDADDDMLFSTVEPETKTERAATTNGAVPAPSAEARKEEYGGSSDSFEITSTEISVPYQPFTSPLPQSSLAPFSPSTVPSEASPSQGSVRRRESPSRGAGGATKEERLALSAHMSFCSDEEDELYDDDFEEDDEEEVGVEDGKEEGGGEITDPDSEDSPEEELSLSSISEQGEGDSNGAVDVRELSLHSFPGPVQHPAAPLSNPAPPTFSTLRVMILHLTPFLSLQELSVFRQCHSVFNAYISSHATVIYRDLLRSCLGVPRPLRASFWYHVTCGSALVSLPPPWSPRRSEAAPARARGPFSPAKGESSSSPSIAAAPKLSYWDAVRQATKTYRSMRAALKAAFLAAAKADPAFQNVDVESLEQKSTDIKLGWVTDIEMDVQRTYFVGAKQLPGAPPVPSPAGFRTNVDSMFDTSVASSTLSSGSDDDESDSSSDHSAIARAADLSREENDRAVGELLTSLCISDDFVPTLGRALPALQGELKGHEDSELKRRHAALDVKVLKAKLRRVLWAYSVTNPKIGYCQGMNMVVRVLLAVLKGNEKRVFHIMCKLSEGASSAVDVPFFISNGFSGGLPRTYEFDEMWRSSGGLRHLDFCFFFLKRLLRKKAPNLSDQFKRLGIAPAFFSSKWFLTLFSCYGVLSYDTLLTVWDIFLLEKSWRVAFDVALGVLKVLENKIRSCQDVEGVMRILQNPISEVVAMGSGHGGDAMGMYDRQIMKWIRKAVVTDEELREAQADFYLNGVIGEDDEDGV